MIRGSAVLDGGMCGSRGLRRDRQHAQRRGHGAGQQPARINDRCIWIEHDATTLAGDCAVAAGEGAMGGLGWSREPNLVALGRYSLDGR